jgi:hypothetical protein
MFLAIPSARGAAVGSFVSNTFKSAALDLNFASTKSLVDSATGLNLVTFTRASSATYVDSAGTLQTAAVDVPRFDHNPTTGESLGLLVEEQRTNSIRNNTMVGAVAGTPGTSPTNWSLGPLSGLTQTIVGTGTESGIAYIDIRIFGTTSSALFCGVGPEGTTVVAANPNSIWTSTFYVRLVGGSLTNVTGVKNVLTNFNSSGAALNQFAVASLTPTSAALATQRYSNSTTSATFADATTAFVRNFLQIEANSGVAIDITLRIGLPQLEQGAFATSVILTSTAVATRSADVADITSIGSNVRSLFAQFRSPASGTRPVVSLDDNTANERIEILTSGTDPKLVVTDGGSAVADLDGGTVAASVTARVAAAFDTNNYAFSVDGGASQLDTSGTLPTVNRIRIGSNQAGGYFNGTIARAAGWATALTNLPPITQ